MRESAMIIRPKQIHGPPIGPKAKAARMVTAEQRHQRLKLFI